MTWRIVSARRSFRDGCANDSDSDPARCKSLPQQRYGIRACNRLHPEDSRQVSGAEWSMRRSGQVASEQEYRAGLWLGCGERVGVVVAFVFGSRAQGINETDLLPLRRRCTPSFCSSIPCSSEHASRQLWTEPGQRHSATSSSSPVSSNRRLDSTGNAFCVPRSGVGASSTILTAGPSPVDTLSA